jgi:hypothetical protein
MFPLNQFRFILIEPSITNSTILHQKLVDFSRITNNGHERWLNQFSSKNDLFNYMIKILPQIREEFQTEVDIIKFNAQKKKLFEMIEKLKSALEEKLK